MEIKTGQRILSYFDKYVLPLWIKKGQANNVEKDGIIISIHMSLKVNGLTNSNLGSFKSIKFTEISGNN